MDRIAHILGRPQALVYNVEWVSGAWFLNLFEKPHGILTRDVVPEHGHIHAVNHSGQEVEALDSAVCRINGFGKLRPEHGPIPVFEPVTEHGQQLVPDDAQNIPVEIFHIHRPLEVPEASVPELRDVGRGQRLPKW